MLTRQLVALWAVAAVSVAAPLGAQRRVPPPPPAGPIARTPPLPTPPPRIERLHDAPSFWRPLERGWGYPLILETAVITPPPVPAPYPVPVYYPVPAAPRVERPAPPPHDPTRSRMTIIGGGADGGGGVMRIERWGGDSIALRWLVPTRPVRSATFFLADDARGPLVSQVIEAAKPRAVFRVGRLPRPAAYAGLTTVFEDGAQRTTLVPLGRPAP